MLVKGISGGVSIKCTVWIELYYCVIKPRENVFADAFMHYVFNTISKHHFKHEQKYHVVTLMFLFM